MGRGSRRGRGVCGLWSVVCVSVSLCPFRGLWMGGEEEEEEEEQQQQQEQQEQQQQKEEELFRIVHSRGPIPDLRSSVKLNMAKVVRNRY